MCSKVFSYGEDELYKTKQKNRVEEEGAPDNSSLMPKQVQT